MLLGALTWNQSWAEDSERLQVSLSLKCRPIMIPIPDKANQAITDRAPNKTKHRGCKIYRGDAAGGGGLELPPPRFSESVWGEGGGSSLSPTTFPEASQIISENYKGNRERQTPK